MPRTAAEAGQVKIDWPDHGVDTSVPFDRQPADTCVVGVNVRWQDPLQHRQRGGSRPGLEKWIAEQPAGATPVQMLGAVIYYDVTALLAVPEQEGVNVPANSPLVPDTSTSNFPNGPGPNGPGGNPQGGPTGGPGFNVRVPPQGRSLPPTGSGVQPNRHVGSPPAPPWSFKQQASDGTISSVAGLAVALPGSVTEGDLLFVAVATYQAASPAVVVTDNEGHTYLQAGGYSTVVDAFGNNLTLSAWYTAWGSLTESATVAVTTSTNGAIRVGVVEVAGEARAGSTASLDGSSAAVDAAPAPNPATMTGGTPAVNFASDGLIGAFATISETDAFTAPAGYTAWINQGTNTGPNLLVVGKLGVSVAEAVTGLVDGYNLYAGVAASFKKG